MSKTMRVRSTIESLQRSTLALAALCWHKRWDEATVAVQELGASFDELFGNLDLAHPAQDDLAAASEMLTGLEKLVSATDPEAHDCALVLQLHFGATADEMPGVKA